MTDFTKPVEPVDPDAAQSVVDDDMVSFFDLLARFDFEDQQKLAPQAVCTEELKK